MVDADNRLRAVCQDCDWNSVAHRTRRAAEQAWADHQGKEPGHDVEYKEVGQGGDEHGPGGMTGGD